MIKDLSSIKIGAIWNQGRGSTFADDIDSDQSLGADVPMTKPIQAHITLIRLQDGLAALVENLTTEVDQFCSRCLEKFTYPIYIANFEREFFEEMPHRGFDPFENFLINKQDMSIDLSESLRQEIILHFPMVPVHSERCKGLCPGCHVNLNGENGAAPQHAPDCPGIPDRSDDSGKTHHPFANLKDLFKNN